MKIISRRKYLKSPLGHLSFLVKLKKKVTEKLVNHKNFMRSVPSSREFGKNRECGINIQSFSDLTCDICSSEDIVETREGYVCRDCGIVLEIQRLEYHRPYNDDIIQYATLGTTQIGFKRERLRHSKSRELETLNKLHSIKDNKEVVLDKAQIEISRILNCLNLSESYKEMIFEKFKKIRKSLRPGTKYRSPEKLVPITVYFCLKLQNISINESELLEVSKISKKDFNAFKLQIQNFIPQYAERNRKDYVLQKVLELTEYFQLDMVFYYQSKKILYKLWDGIKCTKDDVIAGLITSISVLCSYKDEVSISSICDKLGIRMSTIQSQVKKRIFERFKISGFVSLVKSSDLLKDVMNKLGIIEFEQNIIIDTTSTEVSPDLLEIQLGSSAYNVFNSHNNIDYYFYALRDNNGYPLVVSLKVYNQFALDFQEPINEKSGEKIDASDLMFEYEVRKYINGKDPPSS